MGQIRNHQIVNNTLTGTSINSNFKFYDELELPIDEGDVRFWQGRFWQATQDITTVEITDPIESNLTNSPDNRLEWWYKLPQYGTKRFEFEMFQVNEYPLDSSNLNDRWFAMHASRMISNFDSYTNFLFDITNQSNKWYGLQFASEAEFITWINTNVSSNSTLVRVYGLVKGDMYNIHKIQGRNMALGFIKGNDNGNKSLYNKSCCGLNSNWEHMEDFATDVLERITGVTPNSSNAPGSIIFTANKSNLYTLYQTKNCPNTINFNEPSTGGKTKFNPVSNTFSNIVGGDTFNPIIGSNAFYALNISTFNWSFVGLQNMTDSEYVSAQSFVKAYGFEDPSGNVIAVIKPVGMDEFRINYMASGGYDWFGIYYNSDDKPRVERLHSSAYTIFNNMESNISVHLNKSSILQGQKNAKQYNLNHNTLRNVRYFCVASDGYMSDFSNEVQWKIKHNGAKAYTMLHSTVK